MGLRGPFPADLVQNGTDCLPHSLYGLPQRHKPVAHICNHCEDFDRPVTPEGGISIAFPIDAKLRVDLYLHHECADAWAQDFDVSLSSYAKAIGQ